MAAGRELRDYLSVSSGSASSSNPSGGLEEAVEHLYRRAYGEASRLGRIIGRVTRYREVELGEDLTVEVDVYPEEYFSGEPLRIGSYLVIVDPKPVRQGPEERPRRVLGVVKSIVREDELAFLGVEAPMSSYNGEPDPRGVLTSARVKLRLLTEDTPGGVAPATGGVEPQAPVVDPEPWVIAEMLDLPDKGVALGALATPSGLVKGGGVPVHLPYKAFLHHVLVVGTTGSGKTTLLKNMIVDISSKRDHNFVPVVLDMNQDFIQIPLPPQQKEGDKAAEGYDEIASLVYRQARRPAGAVVVAPLTTHVIESCGSIERALECYVSESLEPLAGQCSVECSGNGCRASCGRATYILIPYIVSTVDKRMPSDKLVRLMPGITSNAAELLRVLRERYRRSNPRESYPVIHAVYAALALYLEERKWGKEKRRGEELSDDEVEKLIEEYVSPYTPEDFKPLLRIDDVGTSLFNQTVDLKATLDRVKPHKGTVEALFRRLQALLETGVVDVIVGGSGSARLLREPEWSGIVEEAAGRGWPVVVDLRWSWEKGMTGLEGARLVAYRVLERIIAWRHEEWAARRSGSPKVLLFIDEAHQFFPQEGSGREEQEAVRQVAGMISLMARLGRARGVGLIFSTHSPKDLHEIILQLANTKIVLRTEQSHAEKLGVPSELRSFMPLLQDRYMLVVSHVYRGGLVMAATSKPLTMHYDVSA